MTQRVRRWPLIGGAAVVGWPSILRLIPSGQIQFIVTFSTEAIEHNLVILQDAARVKIPGGWRA